MSNDISGWEVGDDSVLGESATNSIAFDKGFPKTPCQEIVMDMFYNKLCL